MKNILKALFLLVALVLLYASATKNTLQGAEKECIEQAALTDGRWP